MGTELILVQRVIRAEKLKYTTGQDTINASEIEPT
jgi:hypothetical protein